MKRLIVFRVGERWLAQVIESTREGSGSLTRTSWVAVPQSGTEIDEFARREGYAIEWGSTPRPGESPD